MDRDLTRSDDDRAVDPRSIDPRTVEAAAPRFGPREYYADRVTRRGRFRDKDPLQPARLWNRWEWIGLFAWAATVGGSIALARRSVARAAAKAAEPPTSP